MQSGRKSARFACAKGVRLPEREARTPEGPQGAEPSRSGSVGPLSTVGVNQTAGKPQIRNNVHYRYENASHPYLSG